MRGRWIVRGFAWLQRASRPILALGLIVVAAIVVWLVCVQMIPAKRFLAKFDTGKNRAYAYIDRPPGYVGMYQNALGRTIPLNDGTDRVILVAYQPRPWRGNVPMQVRIAAPQAKPAGWPEQAEWNQFDWGFPSVVAELDADLAERVIRDGLPERLRQDIVARADKAGWKPSAGGGSWSGPGRLEIENPRRYFEAP